MLSLKIYTFKSFQYGRIIVCLATWFTLFSLYSHRVNLSVNIIGMVVDNSSTGNPIYQQTDKVSWSPLEKELILMAYNIGYMLSHIPCGILLYAAGLRNVMMVCIILSTILTYISAVAGLNTWAFFVVRILLGASHGPLYPIVHEVIASYAPPSERTWLVLLTHTGNLICLVFTLPFGGYLISNVVNGWKVLFFVTGSFGIGAFVLWFIFVYSHPDQNPWLSKKEQDYIITSINPSGQSHHMKVSDIPFKKILTCQHIYFLSSAHFGKAFILYMNLFGLVKYLRDYYKLTKSDSANYAVIPFIIDFVFQIFYPKIVQIMKSKGMGLTRIRKLNTLIGAIGCSVFLIGAAFIKPSNFAPGIVLISISLLFLAPYQAGYFTAIVEIAPEYSGINMAFINVFGSLAGIVQRYITGELLKSYHPDVEKAYFIAFVITSVISFCTSFVYVLFGTADPMPWSKAGKKSVKYDRANETVETALVETSEIREDELKV